MIVCPSAHKSWISSPHDPPVLPRPSLPQMLWRGLEAFEAAAELLAAAEAAVEEAAAAGTEGAEGIRRPFAWHTGMLRPARSAKQAADIARFLAADPASAAATHAEAVTEPAALAALVPGLQPELLLAPEPPKPEAEHSPAAAQRRRQQAKQQQQQQRQQPAAGPPALGLMVHAGTTIHPESYMRALWMACQQLAAGGRPGSAAAMRQLPVTSLRQLQAAEGPFDAVVVAAGAAVGSIAELQGLLPLDLCHGFSLDMRPAGWRDGESSSTSSGGLGSTAAGSPGSSSSSGGGGSSSAGGYPVGAPSLLGSPYIAAHGSSSAVVGATKRHGLTPAEAFEQLSRPIVHSAEEAAAAAAELLPPASQLWPPLEGWQVERVRAGVRALPLRGSDGELECTVGLMFSVNSRQNLGLSPGVPGVACGVVPECLTTLGQGRRAWLPAGMPRLNPEQRAPAVPAPQARSLMQAACHPWTASAPHCLPAVRQQATAIMTARQSHQQRRQQQQQQQRVLPAM